MPVQPCWGALHSFRRVSHGRRPLCQLEARRAVAAEGRLRH